MGGGASVLLRPPLTLTHMKNLLVFALFLGFGLSRGFSDGQLNWFISNQCTTNISIAGWKVQTSFNGGAWADKSFTAGAVSAGSSQFAFYNPADVAGNTVAWRYVNGSGGTVVSGTYNCTGNESAVTVYTYILPNCSSNWYCARAIVRNVDSLTRNYRAFANGVAIETRAIAPGDLWEFIYCNSVYKPVYIARLNADGAIEDAAFFAQYGTNTSVINASTNSDFTALLNQYQGGTSNILWGTNAPNVGDSALYDALTKFANQNHIDLSALIGKDETYSNYVSVLTSNKIDIVVTNTAASTNWLSEINKNLTNGAAASNQIVSAFPTWGTNGQEALDKATQILDDGGVKSSMDRLKEKLAAPEISGPDEPDLTMEFMGRTIDLNPAHQWPGLAAMCRAGFELMLWVWFVTKMVNVFWDNLKLLGASKVSGVGNWQGAGVLGWGTGLFGMVTGIAVPAAFSAIFVFAMKWFLDHFFDKIAAGLNWGNWITLLGVGYALLDAWFPISTFISLTCTYWISSLSVGMVASTAMLAARHLLGK